MTFQIALLLNLFLSIAMLCSTLLHWLSLRRAWNITWTKIFLAVSTVSSLSFSAVCIWIIFLWIIFQIKNPTLSGFQDLFAILGCLIMMQFFLNYLRWKAVEFIPYILFAWLALKMLPVIISRTIGQTNMYVLASGWSLILILVISVFVMGIIAFHTNNGRYSKRT